MLNNVSAETLTIGGNTPPALVSIGLGLWYLTPHSTILQQYRGVTFYWWSKQECPVQTTDLPQITDKLLYSSKIVMLYTLPGVVCITT